MRTDNQTPAKEINSTTNQVLDVWANDIYDANNNQDDGPTSRDACIRALATEVERLQTKILAMTAALSNYEL